MEHMTYEELYHKYMSLQNQLQYYEEYDSLTGVYNKNTFSLKVSQILQNSPSDSHAIICVDVERFKVINDLFGTDAGNLLLQYLARALKDNALPDSAVLGRISADIFAAYIPDTFYQESLEQNILTLFQSAPISADVIPAVGIYYIHDLSLSVDKMCDRAILALNSIKGNYLKHTAIYDESLWNNILQEQEIISRADYALEHNEFQVYMQPKCNIRTGKVVGAEALVRWKHAEKGLVSPIEFIPVFEKNGFIKKLDTFVWEQVADWLSTWISDGNPPIPISVNVSRVDIVAMDLLSILGGICQKYNVNASLLELEITESAYTNHVEQIVSMIEQLMRSGHTVLMDDFGSGYSSLNMLKDINIDVLKLDLRFLDKTNQKSRDILESVVQMAKWLNLRIIAEGVETKSQVDFLLGIGCEYAQGFYFYKPMPLNEFNNLLKRDTITDFEDHQRKLDIKNNLINFKELIHSDMLSEQLLNNILGGIALYQYENGRLTVIRCNQEYCRLVSQNHSISNLNNQDIFDLLHEDDKELLRSALEKAVQLSGEGTEAMVRRYTQDKTCIWLQMRLFHLANTNGKTIFYASLSDVNDIMTTLEALRMSEQRFRIAMDASKNTLFEVDIATRTAHYAQHSQQEFGLEDCVADAPEGFIKQGSVCPAYEDRFREIYYAIYRGEDYASDTIQACMGDGSIVWNRITLSAVKDKNGKTVKAVGLVENVTKERKLEEQLSLLDLKNPTIV